MDLKQIITPKVVRWLVVGFLFAVASLGLLKLLASSFAWPYAVATFCSGEICTILRFLVVDRWVFSHRAPTWKKLRQYHVANALGFGIWWSVANLLKIAGVHYMLAAVLAMFFSVGFNILSNFHWIWRKPATAGVSQESR
jgi:putative flippase GtrA